MMALPYIIIKEKEQDDKIDILSGISGVKEKTNKSEFDAHLLSTMPHLIIDEDSGKKYRVGRRFKDGGMQTIWEEVV